MIRRCYVLLLAVASLAVGASLSGCGSSSGPAPAAATAPAANVTLAAKFPTADGAVKSLLPANTAAIEVFAINLPISQSVPVPTLLATLTPAAPSKAVKLAPGQYLISATAYNSTDPATRTVLGETSTAGEVLANVPNIINLTFLNGQWNLATPVVLSDGVTQLNDFVVTGEGVFAAKSAFDFTKPIGGGGGGVVKLRFNNNTSARTFGTMITQFVGATNSNALFADAYNLTRKCQDNNQQNCAPASGDKLIIIEGTPAGGRPTGDISSQFFQGDLLFGHADVLLPNKGETSFSQPILANTAAATTDGKTITGNLIEFALTATPTRTYKTGISPAKALPAAVKSVQSANTAYTGLVVTDYSLMICATTATPNQGGWQFFGPAQTLGTATCYDSGQLNPTFSPTTQQLVYNAGDFSYGLSPATADLGDYCHQWDFLNNVCQVQQPPAGDIYYPFNFTARRTATKTTINYGSFKVRAWIEQTTTGNAYVYPFTANGTSVVTPAR